MGTLDQIIYCWVFKYSSKTDKAWVSSPKSVTTAHEHLTTLVAAPSSSILHKPHYSPSCILLGNLRRLTLCSLHSALTSLTYAGSSQSSARHKMAEPNQVPWRTRASHGADYSFREIFNISFNIIVHLVLLQLRQQRPRRLLP